MDGSNNPSQPPKPLTIGQRMMWNNFIDYLDKIGYKGSKSLDNRNMALGENMLNRFNQSDPKNAISYQQVAQVQKELQDYRAGVIDKWKKGGVKIDGVKTEDDVMPGLSKVDGWLGSKTSSWKYPTAVLTHSDGSKQSFGVNTENYDATVAPQKK